MSTEDVKEAWEASATPLGENADQGIDQHGSLSDDRAAMFRMGKAQELQRNFRFLTIFGFSVVLTATWEVSFGVAGFSLQNGGTAGYIWMFLVAWIGYMFINTSMAEMGSMAPTSGGQYHWVSEFSPRKYQKFLSYLIGWLCVLGWQAGCAGTAFTAGTEIQGLIVLGFPNYSYENWHGTLITIAIAAFSVFFNTILAKKMPLIEGIILIIHVFAFFGILVTLWVLGPKKSATEVFTGFTDGGGWGSLGTSALVGLGLSSINPQIGADAAVHMSEELRDAQRNIPRSMLWSTGLNGISGLAMAITFSFVLGDVQKDIDSPTGYAFLQVFFDVTGSSSGGIAMGVFIVIMLIASDLTFVATASRQLYAFARDDAVPFSKTLSTVNKRFNVPFYAIIVTFITTSLLALINIGSSTALNSINSLATMALLSSYLTSIGCITWRRIAGMPLLPSKFDLGKWGLPVNLISIMFLLIFIVFSCFPSEGPNPTGETMNYSFAIWFLIVIFSLVYFVLVSRHKYKSPVEYVRKLD